MKTLEQTIEFNFLATNTINSKEKETKCIYAIKRVKKNCVDKIVNDYSEKQDAILNKYAATGEHGEALRNENGTYILSKENERKATKELKDLWEIEKGVEYEITPYIATSLEGHDFSETELEILQGFVVE